LRLFQVELDRYFAEKALRERMENRSDYVKWTQAKEQESPLGHVATPNHTAASNT